MVMAKQKPKAEPTDSARDPDAMTGEAFLAARKAFGLIQSKMADELGLGFRTVVRYESAAFAKIDIPLPHAKLVRCLAKERGISLGKSVK